MHPACTHEEDVAGLESDALCFRTRSQVRYCDVMGRKRIVSLPLLFRPAENVEKYSSANNPMLRPRINAQFPRRLDVFVIVSRDFGRNNAVVEVPRLRVCKVPEAIPLTARLRIEAVGVVKGSGANGMYVVLQRFPVEEGWMRRVQWKVERDDLACFDVFLGCLSRALRSEKVEPTEL